MEKLLESLLGVLESTWSYGDAIVTSPETFEEAYKASQGTQWWFSQKQSERDWDFYWAQGMKITVIQDKHTGEKFILQVSADGKTEAWDSKDKSISPEELIRKYQHGNPIDRAGKSKVEPLRP